MDSGACDHVGPPSVLPALPIQQTEASKRNLYYSAANGTKIPNIGCKDIAAVSDLNDGMTFRMQCGEGTTNVLASVMRFTAAGCKVVFEDKGDYAGYIEEQHSGRWIPIIKKHGKYIMNMWVHQDQVKEPQHNLQEMSQQLTGETVPTPKTQDEEEDSDDADHDCDAMITPKSPFARLGAAKE